MPLINSPLLAALRGKNPIDINEPDADRIYRTPQMIKYAQEQAKDLLGKKPDVKHWTQGAAYLLDTLAGVKYQNIAGDQATGNQEDKSGVVRGSIRAGKPYGDESVPEERPTDAIPPAATPPAAASPADIAPNLPPEKRAELEAIKPPPGIVLDTKPTAKPVPTPERVMANPSSPIEKSAEQTADAMPFGGVPEAPKKVNPFDLSAKRPALPDVKPEAGWKPVITPMFDEKAPYNRRVRKPEDIKHLVFHHDTAQNAQNLAKYGHKIDQKRGFDPGYNYYIDRDGQIIQGVPDDRTPNHMLPGYGKKGAGVTSKNSIAVVMAGVDGEKNKPTEKQLEAAMHVAGLVSDKYKISPDKVFGHGQVNPGHRQPGEGMEAVEKFVASRAKKPEEAAPAMALGMPPGAPPGTPESLVQLAQYRQRPPSGPEPEQGVAPPKAPGIPGHVGQPFLARPGLTRQQEIGILMDADPSAGAETAKRVQEIQTPERIQTNQPFVQQENQVPGKGAPRAITNVGNETVMINNIPYTPSIGENGQLTYVPKVGGIQGSGNAPVISNKANIEKAAETLRETAPLARAGGTLTGVNNAAAGAITKDAARRDEDMDRGWAAVERANKLKAMKGIVESAGTGLAMGKFGPKSMELRGIVENMFPGLVTPSTKDAELVGMLSSGLQTAAEKEMANRGNSMRFGMVQAANPSLAGTLTGLKAQIDFHIQMAEQEQKWAKEAIKHTNLSENDYLQKKMDFYKANPLTVDVKEGKLYLQKFDTTEERNKIVPVGGLYLNSNNQMVRRKPKKDE